MSKFPRGLDGVGGADSGRTERANGGGSSRGFTLLEILVVVSIIGILAAVMFPALKGMVSKAQGAVCLNHLRVIHSSLLAYAAESNGYLPLVQNGADDNRAWVGTLVVGGYIESKRFTSSVQHDPLYCPGSSRNRPVGDYIYGNYGLNSRLAGLSFRSSAGPVMQTPPPKLASINNPSKKILVADAGSYLINHSSPIAPNALSYLPGMPINAGRSWPEASRDDAVEGRHGGRIHVLMAGGNVEILEPEQLTNIGSWLPE